MFRFLWIFLLIGCFLDQLGFPPLTILKAALIQGALQRQESIVFQSSELLLLSFLTVLTFVSAEMVNVNKPLPKKAGSK